MHGVSGAACSRALRSARGLVHTHERLCVRKHAHVHMHAHTHTHMHARRYTLLPCFVCVFADKTRAELRKKYNLVEEPCGAFCWVQTLD